MDRPADTAAHAGREAEHVAEESTDNRPVRFLGRVGLVAHGVVHLLIAYLAVRVAFGGRHTSTDQSGALATIGGTPGGRVLLWAVVLALVALVIWQLHAALWGHRRFEGQTKRSFKRLASAGKVVVFGLLAANAAKLALGSSSSSTAKHQQTFTARVLAMPSGQVLVAAVGIGVLTTAAFLAYHGLRRRFTEDLDLSRAGPAAHTAADVLGQIGYVAVGVAYGTVGVLVVLAAVRYDPKKAAGLDAALKTLASQPYGRVVLTVVAAGLVSFGLYRLFDARYRRN